MLTYQMVKYRASHIDVASEAKNSATLACKRAMTVREKTDLKTYTSMKATY